MPYRKRKQKPRWGIESAVGHVAHRPRRPAGAGLPVRHYPRRVHLGAAGHRGRQIHRPSPIRRLCRDTLAYAPIRGPADLGDGDHYESTNRIFDSALYPKLSIRGYCVGYATLDNPMEAVSIYRLEPGIGDEIIEINGGGRPDENRPSGIPQRSVLARLPADASNVGGDAQSEGSHGSEGEHDAGDRERPQAGTCARVGHGGAGRRGGRR